MSISKASHTDVCFDHVATWQLYHQQYTSWAFDARTKQSQAGSGTRLTVAPVQNNLLIENRPWGGLAPKHPAFRKDHQNETWFFFSPWVNIMHLVTDRDVLFCFFFFLSLIWGWVQREFNSPGGLKPRKLKPIDGILSSWLSLLKRTEQPIRSKSHMTHWPFRKQSAFVWHFQITIMLTATLIIFKNLSKHKLKLKIETKEESSYCIHASILS